VTDQPSTLPRPSAPGRATGRKELSFKILAETLKYCCFDVLIAIGLPPFISIPLRLQEAAVDKSVQSPGVTGLIGLPDVMISCAILAWAAMRDTLDADHMDESVRQICLTLTFVIGVAAVGLAMWARNITFANFSTANSFLYNSILTVLASSLATAGAISIARGMQRGGRKA
jgi:hypothetical protein